MYAQTSSSVQSASGLAFHSSCRSSQPSFGVPARLADLERMGIDQQVIFPTMFLTTTTEDVQLEAAMMRAKAYALTLVLGAAVLLPAIPGLMGDDFPISTYPMFSGRQSETATIARAEGVRVDGSATRLEPSLVANDEVIQAFETLRQAIRQGPEASLALCLRIAGKMSADAYTEVRLLAETYDVIEYFDSDKEPLASRVHASCEVQQ